MTPKPRRVLLGWVAGIISAAVTLFVAYIAGVVAMAVHTRDLFATLLAAVTLLPLTLLLVFLPLDLLVGTAAGLLLGLCSRLTGRTLGALVGTVFGLVVAEIVFSLLLPLVIKPQPSGDFITIISSPYLSGIYGVILGSIAGIVFRRLNRDV